MTRSRISCHAVAAIATAFFAVLSAPPTAQAQTPTKLSIVVFGFPSLGAFMPPVIKAKGFDKANGLDIAFVERPPTAYTTQFNSGEFKVGGSAALLTVGLADERGVKVQYLFNLFDFWGGVVTSRPAVKTVKDLEGQEVAAARATTNFQMFDFFARKLGADTSKIKVVNTAPPGLVGYAVADRAAAVQLWEPAYTLLKAKKPDVRLLDLQLDKTWKAFAGSTDIPYLGIAAHTDWIAANPGVVPKLYAAYKAAGDFIRNSPEDAAKMIDAKGTADSRAALVSLIKANDRLGMNVAGAAGMKAQIEAVYKAGIDVGYLKKMPSPATIYDKPLK
jgi:ABC-type nitrate/sulfonate/bicarbonate transport system substrate-binding protein